MSHIRPWVGGSRKRSICAMRQLVRLSLSLSLSLSRGKSSTHGSQVIEGVKLGAQTTVDAQELFVHDGSQGQAAEGLHAGLVNGLGVLVLALELEGKVVGQVATLVVTAEQPQGLGVVDLQAPEIQDALDAEVASVDIVAEEKVSRLGGVAPNFEELHQIVVLAVDVTADGDGRIHLEQVGLGAEQFCAGSKNPEGLLLGQAAFTIEVLLEKVDVGLGMGLVLKELFVRGREHGGGLYVCGGKHQVSSSKAVWRGASRRRR
ncbi:hypothetical protein CTA1_2028 [Colletotrichum tanaceti]|uniref:Uncharacterized protein n=1 Tax=Colletotrichum tanaceti TaxID=1306861 RepID=A0A4U6X7C7_9PEZI|nr:hypothetical protein CTA1_2028 [Colletotrichum tanaceti]